MTLISKSFADGYSCIYIVQFKIYIQHQLLVYLNWIQLIYTWFNLSYIAEINY